MICPKCGTEIKEGYLYCQKCGEEVIMVPDYEVELEAGIEETISEVAEMMADTIVVEAKEPDAGIYADSTGKPDFDEDVQGLSQEPAGKRVDHGSVSDGNIFVRFISRMTNRKSVGPGIVIAAAIVLGLVLVFGILKITRTVQDYYDFDFQYEKARSEFADGDYEAVVSTARHVVSLRPAEEKPRLLLADSYFKLEKYDEAIAVLTDLLKDFPQDQTIYERLIANYETEGDIDSIIRLSGQAGNAAISALFDDYVSDAPEFSVDSGSYFEPQSVRLMSSKGGTIYYTVDGSEPDKNSEVYTTPIRIDEGETVLSAIHINEKGIASEVIQKTYTVKIIATEVPQVITEGGDYTVPKLIKVKSPQSGTIYYTTDGTDPELSNSKEYEQPLPMPLGKSEYRFAIISDSGVSSEVVTVKYNLKISGVVDKATAQSAVQLKLITLGHAVMDHEFTAKYGYSANDRNYYIVEEYSTTDGKKRRENTLYAVDTTTGEVFTITRNTGKGDYDFGVVL